MNQLGRALKVTENCHARNVGNGRGDRGGGRGARAGGYRNG